VRVTESGFWAAAHRYRGEHGEARCRAAESSCERRRVSGNAAHVADGPGPAIAICFARCCDCAGRASHDQVYQRGV